MFKPSGRWDGGWLAVVEEYSRRNLTYGKDKLPALAGLARVIANETDDEYYAGLWRDHIVEDLYWGVCIPDPTSGQFAWENTRVSEAYRAPSWSWALLDAQVKFIPLDLRHAVVDLIHCHTVPAGVDHYGELTGGYIKLLVSTTRVIEPENTDRAQAPLFLVHKSTSPPNDDSTKRSTFLDEEISPYSFLGAYVPVELHLDHGVSEGKAFFDIKPQFPCSALFLDPQHALLLKAREFQGEFTRIGIAYFWGAGIQREDQSFIELDVNKKMNVPYGQNRNKYKSAIVTIL